MSDAMRVNEFAKLLYDTSAGCSQGEAVRVYTELFLENARFRERLAEIVQCGCTNRMLEWARSDIRKALTCTPDDRCSPCRCRALLAALPETT